MRIRVIACEVLFREVCLCAARSPHIIDLEFLPRGLHDNPETLRAQLQQAIDAVQCHSGPFATSHSEPFACHSERSEESDPAQDKLREECQRREDPSLPLGVAGAGSFAKPVKYDAIALGYGLCSNGALGLAARDAPLVIPRAHDCITFFLGSKDIYHRHFHDEPGTYYYTSGWIERAGHGVPRTREEGEGLQMSYQEMVEKYGEDNAAYLLEVQQAWIKNYRRAAFIGLGLGPQEALRAEAMRVAQERSWGFEDLPGDLRLVRKLVDGEWDDSEFLVVQRGQVVARGGEDDILAVGEVVTSAGVEDPG